MVTVAPGDDWGMVQTALEITHITRDDLQILREFCCTTTGKITESAWLASLVAIGARLQPGKKHPAASGVAQWPGTRMEL